MTCKSQSSYRFLDRSTYRNDLNDGEHEFGLSIASDSEEVDHDHSSPEDNDPRSGVDITGTGPI